MALSKVILIALIGLSAAFVPSGNWKTRFVGSYETNSTGYWSLAMSWDENTAYAIDGNNEEVVILDTTDKHRPTLLGVYSPGYEVGFTSLVLSEDENTLFITTYWENEGVHVVNVTDKTDPTWLSYLDDADGEMTFIVLSPDNQFAYVSDTWNCTIDIFNITDLSYPQLLNWIEMSGPQGLDISSDGNTLFATDYDMGLVIIDVCDYTSPSISTTWYDEGCEYWLVKISHDGDTAYVSDWYEGLWILDVSDYACGITLLANWGFGSTGNVQLTEDDSIAFVVDQYQGEGLTILDVSEPCYINALGRYTDNAENYAQVALGYANWARYAYVVDGYEGNGLVVIGLAPPCDPTFQWDWTYPRHKEYQEAVMYGVNPLYVIMGIESQRPQ